MSSLYKISHLALVACAALSLTGCQDEWADHYDQEPAAATGTQSVYEIIASRPELSDFRAVLDAARLFAGNRITTTTYRELLDGDQFFTVAAPVNGTFNRDSLIQLCQTSQGDSLVELHFLKNHIARYAHSAVAGKDEKFKLFNGKASSLSGMKYGDATIQEANIPTRNGILHVLQQPATYRYNIYEALFSLPEYRHIGDFLKSYQIDEFDETQSLAMGVVDGKTVYIDSVFVATNRLLSDYVYGHIDREDSTYWMLVPDRNTWEALYDEASTYFQYGNIQKADSIHEYWTNYALLQDLVYNPQVQRSLNDSLCSTTWNTSTAGRYHVYYQPFAANGLMSYSANELPCSNGTIYNLREWPFEKTRTYFRKITTEGEGRVYDYFEATGKTLSLTSRSTSADSVSNRQYMDILPQTQYDSYYVTYEIRDVLSGKYDVCAVILPKTVYDPNYDPEVDKKQFRPNKFTAEIFYNGIDGREYSVSSGTRYKFDENNPGYYVAANSSETDVPFLFDCNFNATTASTRAFTNDPYRVDTIRLATIQFPACNYDQVKTTTRVKLKNNITNKQTNTYNAEMFLDCILFIPHKD